jgi:hypothetical protein
VPVRVLIDPRLDADPMLVDELGTPCEVDGVEEAALPQESQ